MWICHNVLKYIPTFSYILVVFYIWPKRNKPQWAYLCLKLHLLNIIYLGYRDSQKLNYCIKNINSVKLFSKRVVSISTPTSTIWVCLFHYTFLGSSIFISPPFLFWWGESLSVLICISLIINEAKHFFPYVLTKPFDQWCWHITDLTDSHFPYSYPGSNPQKTGRGKKQ